MTYYIGVDVGTQSVRSSLINELGVEEATNSVPLTVYNPQPDHYEQCCTEIWSGVCETVRAVTKDVPPGDVHGVGFDATCSLVMVDGSGNPLPITCAQSSACTEGPAEKNRTCLMWMDHRAQAEALTINGSTSPVLDYVGGGFSPEQQPPKLLWVKRNLPDTWARAAHFLDLPDWLTFRATGNPARSLCSVTCKWGYVRHRGGWDRAFLAETGLGDVSEKLGEEVLGPGSPVPGGLSESSALQLGLLPGTPVAVSMIDAHAGTLAMLGFSPRSICETLCVISGTSTCIMGQSRSMSMVPGVWGPYEGVVLPGVWLYEGGQTAAGSALDHIVQSHPSYSAQLTYSKLNADLGADLGDSALHKRTQHVHIQPDLHGNRSPLAAPWMRGMVCGLDLNKDYSNLLTTYLAAVQGLALGVQHVLDRLVDHGLEFSQVVVSGGLADNPLYLLVLATVTNLPVLVPRAGNMMCAGAALLGRAAAQGKPLMEVLEGREEAGSEVYMPLEGLVQYYGAKYEVYRLMTAHQVKYREIMCSKTLFSLIDALKD